MPARRRGRGRGASPIVIPAPEPESRAGDVDSRLRGNDGAVLRLERFLSFRARGAQPRNLGRPPYTPVPGLAIMGL